ncbi:MAG: zinc ribbon domain-containing protein [Candidatus Aenigmarchaeota archaeon]|nr:zinc ribbon domain-containing protein [Candidatus Aenigmarchaeota archaeon]
MVRCPRCGTQNDDGWDRCSNCGATLALNDFFNKRAEEERIKKEYGEDKGVRKRQEALLKLEKAAAGTRGEGVIHLPGEVEEPLLPPPSRWGRVRFRAGRDVGKIVKGEKVARTTIDLKIKSRFTEAVIVCAIASFAIIFFHQNWLGAALFLLAFYIFLPNEYDVMNEAREAVEKKLKIERGKEEEETLKEEAKRGFERRRGEIKAEREYGR